MSKCVINAVSFSSQAENLKENVFYHFRVRAMNMAGVSGYSLPSATLECKEWTITVPGIATKPSTSL